MAKKTENQGANASYSGAWAEKMAELAPVAPELYVHRPDRDGEPNPIAGILLERRELRYKDGRDGAMYVLATTLPTWLWDGDLDQWFEAPAGSFALVAERKALEDLRRYLPTQGPNGFESVCEVAIVPKNRVKLAGGKTMWRFDIRGRKLQAAASPVALLAPPTSAAKQLPAASEEAFEPLPF